ncbi:oxidoreductase domain protein [Roseibium sp. TrichSKD4]|uniref:Gfo/Idh/MocA family protein n=1 Tax=Roseibium sp. TrichSKD4 TaxID=744980 RepID=UPI0001E57117|nr:Gfo/Idh/MocA family oxidoreductase [Roseibium sp. TrichSKD4]EFO29601.1 oxidoreductase domain protein [Roseibium sp. TrichSKD4]
MSEVLGVGIIGCGNISKTYFELAPLFKGIEVRYCADLYADVARARASEYGVMGGTVDMLLASNDVDIVVNLTVPDAHWPVSRDILSAGKHVYSEKPLVLSLEDGKAMQALAAEKGLRVGSAPDTFLGGAHQAARAAIDSGELGKITSGTCQVMSHGMEAWHPNPDFFFKPGGGPVLDMGPYYIANLINLIGPVKRVAALTSMATPTRTISSQPRAGEEITVETPTTIQALLEFQSGATITFIASWDVCAHRHHPMELYGTEGSIYVPDPNFFGGSVTVVDQTGEAKELDVAAHPLGQCNQGDAENRFANYRTAGLADMAQAIREGRDFRCSFDRAVHAVDVMMSILKSGETGSFVEIVTTCTRPEAFGADEAGALLK